MIVAVNQPLEITLPDLLRNLKDVNNWETFGIFLLPNHTSEIEDIKRTCNKADDCMLQLYQLYIRVGDNSWKTVAEALKEAGYPKIAERIEYNFLS